MKIKTSGNLAYQIRPSLTEDTRIQRFVKSTMLYFILYKHIEFVDRFNTPVTWNCSSTNNRIGNAKAIWAAFYVEFFFSR